MKFPICNECVLHRSDSCHDCEDGSNFEPEEGGLDVSADASDYIQIFAEIP